MEAKRRYEEEILQAFEELPEEQLAKVVSLVGKLREEEKTKKIDGYRKAIEEARGKYKHLPGSVDDFMRRKEEEKKLDR